MGALAVCRLFLRAGTALATLPIGYCNIMSMASLRVYGLVLIASCDRWMGIRMCWWGLM
jgi:hypothetical protein